MTRCRTCRSLLLAVSFLVGMPFLFLQAQEAPRKLPVPDRPLLQKAEALVNDIFKDDFASAKDPESLSKLAALLLEQARDPKDEPANRYVLFHKGLSLAAGAGDATLALSAIDDLARDFQVAALNLKAESLAQALAATKAPEAAKNLVAITLPLIGEAIEADNYAAAKALGKVAEEAARRSRTVSLVLAMQKKNEEILAVEKGYARFQAYVDRLKKDAMDAEANLELGKYYAFLKGRWEKALPLLAMGGDKALKAQARRDLSQPKDARDRLGVADGWWDLAEKTNEPMKAHLERRALHWYEQAVGELTGLSRTKAAKRIEKIAARLAGSPTDGPAGPVGELRKLDGHGEEVKAVAFSLDGRFAVSGSIDNTVRVWDLVSGKELKRLTGHTKQVWAVAFLPTGRQVLSASWDATVRLWDIQSGAEVKRFTHRLDVNGLALNRSGTSMLTGSDDHNVYLWDVSTGEEIKRFPGHNNFVYGVAFAPDGRHIASGSVDKTARVYDLTTGTTVKVIQGHTNAVSNVVFSLDSRRLFTCGDNAAHMWEIATGRQTKRFEGHAGLVHALALSPDGRRLITAGDDKTIRVWDIGTAKELHKLQGHTESISCLAISSDGRRLLSGGMDRTVRLWGLPR